MKDGGSNYLIYIYAFCFRKKNKNQKYETPHSSLLSYKHGYKSRRSECIPTLSITLIHHSFEQSVDFVGGGGCGCKLCIVSALFFSFSCGKEAGLLTVDQGLSLDLVLPLRDLKSHSIIPTSFLHFSPLIYFLL